MSLQLSRALIDDLIDLYVDWREECDVVALAYAGWTSVAAADRELAFAAYRAALEREQQASAVYSDHVERVERELEPSRASR